MSKKIHLLVIDPQNDFCSPDGSLFVKGADQDMSRLTKMVKRVGEKLDDIHVTLDCHHLIDIAHPPFWKDAAGNHPAPFTLITKAQVQDHVWVPTVSSHFGRALDYVTKLEANKRYPLVVWPPHCLIGSQGNNVYPELLAALTEWEKEQFAIVDYVTKGSNPWTEHYSPFVADVPDPTDPSTQINTRFIQTLHTADILAIAGEAGSHCLANAIRDIVANSGPEFAQKIVLLKDATSPVTGFEGLQDDMIREMVANGMKISTTTEFLT